MSNHSDAFDLLVLDDDEFYKPPDWPWEVLAPVLAMGRRSRFGFVFPRMIRGSIAARSMDGDLMRLGSSCAESGAEADGQEGNWVRFSQERRPDIGEALPTDFPRETSAG